MKEPLAPVILAAVSLEMGPLRRRLVREGPWHTPRPLRLVRYRGPGGPVDLGLTGMGPERAARAAEILVARGRPPWILTIGLAGALDASLQIGDVLVATTGFSPEPSEDPKRSPRLISAWRSPEGNDALHEFFFSRTRSVAQLVTMPHIVATAQEKKHLAQACPPSTIPAMVEMETAALMNVFHTAWHDEVPVVSLRAVSDLAQEDLAVDFTRFQAFSGRIQPFRLLGYFLREPQASWALMRLVRHSKRAAENLAEVVWPLLVDSTFLQKVSYR